MNKKTKTYLLLALVLVVWGSIGYKIVNGLNPQQPELVAQNNNVDFKPKSISKLDTFSIQEVKKDPFLGTLLYSKSNNKTTLVKPSKSTTNQSQALITYSGLVKNQKASDKVYVVNINSKQYLLKQGQTADSVKLIKGDTKQVTVGYNNKRLTIKRQ